MRMTDESMVERVARAIWDDNDSMDARWEDLGAGTQRVMRKRARAAIAAMRDPPDEVIREGWLAAHRIQTEDRCNNEMLRRALDAMIDAALSPK